MSYQKQTWIDDETAITADRLNHIEEGIETKAERGPKGDTGPRGATGERGPQGAIGPAGKDAEAQFTPEEVEALKGLLGEE